MMERYLVTDQDNDFYKRCEKYRKEYNEIFEKAYKYMSEYKVKKNEVGLRGSSIFVPDTKENRDKFNGMIKKNPINGFLEFKKNSRVGKGWTEEMPYSPSFWFNVLNIRGRFAQTQFIFENKLYIRISSETDFKVPKGFVEIKASEFYLLCEKIKQNKLKVYNI